MIIENLETGSKKVCSLNLDTFRVPTNKGYSSKKNKLNCFLDHEKSVFKALFVAKSNFKTKSRTLSYRGCGSSNETVFGEGKRGGQRDN